MRNKEEDLEDLEEGVEQGQKVTEDSDNIVKRLHFVCM